MSSSTADLLERALPEMDEAAVRAEFDEAVKADGRPLSRIAPETGIAYGTISAWRAGTYKGDNGRVTNAAHAWLIGREARARTRATLPVEPGFMLTKTAGRIWEVCDFAKAMPTIGVVVGDAGCGKSIALEGYAANYPQTTWIVTMSSCHARIFAMLVQIAQAMDVGIAGRPVELFMRITERLKRAAGLLIVDEAQHLSPEALDQLRSIFDAARAGLVLAGNRDLDAHMGIARRHVQLAQIASRVGVRCPIKRPLKPDIALLLDAWQVAGEAERVELEAVAMQPGGLRGLTMTLRIAFGLALGANAPLNVEHVRAAWAQLSGRGA